MQRYVQDQPHMRRFERGYYGNGPGAWTEHARLAASVNLLTGGPLTDERIEQVAAAVAQEVVPLDDFCGSVEYRREMAAVLTRRALAMCQNKSQREK